MKRIMSDVSILSQGEGIEGMYKHIEKCARISYKSEDKITENSWERFIKMLKGKGHWSCFEQGTVYLKISTKDVFIIDNIQKLILDPHTKVYREVIDYKYEYYYITTNYRVILKLELQELMEKYWCEPIPGKHEPRITSHWICSRGVSHELVRHRIMSFIQESQRYVGYDKDKFGGELVFILPQWMYKVRNSRAHYCDPLTGESREWLFNEDGEELWKSLCCIDRTVSSRDSMWSRIEDEYIWERSTDESEQLLPEEARGILCNDTKTELCMTGFLSDYIEEPDKDSPEKLGFFYLRCASDAHPDIRILAIKLKKLFEDSGLC